MDPPLSRRVRASIRDQVERLAREHHLDQTLEREVYRYAELQLRAQREDSSHTTEEEALLFVRTLLHDPEIVAVVRRAYEADHPRPPMLPRLLVAAITTLACVQVVAWFAHGIDVCLGLSGERVPNPVVLCYAYLTAFFSPALFFLRWKKREARGADVWFTRWNAPALTGLCGLLLASSMVVPGRWNLFGGPTDMAHSLQYYIVFTAHVGSMGAWICKVLGASLLINAAALAVITAVLFQVARRSQSNRVAAVATRLLLVLLWCAPVAVYTAEALALRFYSGLGDNPKDIAELLWALPAQSIGILAGLACCCSWLWWSCPSPRRFRDAAKAASAWFALVVVQVALPAIGIRAALGANEQPGRDEHLWIQLHSIALFLVDRQGMFIGLFWALGAVSIASFLATIAVITLCALIRRAAARSVAPS